MTAEAGFRTQGAGRSNREVRGRAQFRGGRHEGGAHLAGDLVFAQDDGIEPGRHCGQTAERFSPAQVVRCGAGAIAEPVGLKALATHHDRIVRVRPFDLRAGSRHFRRAERNRAPGTATEVGQGGRQDHKVD